MTTIAYRDGVLAADTQVSGGGTRTGSIVKVVKAPDGFLGAACGNAAFCRRWLEWVRVGPARWDAVRPEPNGEGAGVLVHPCGKVEQFFDSGMVVEEAPYLAWGSGDELAMGALWMGADAEKAVHAAIAHNTGTGGRVVAVSLDGGSRASS